jgi:FemAB-related protein (PEP-CTERM system-associated)
MTIVAESRDVTMDVAAHDAAVWARTVDEDRHSTPAHSREWLDVIHLTYGHEPLYLRAEDDEGRTAVLPAFIVRRPLLGTVVTSMPFLDTGGPCSASSPLAGVLVGRLVEEAGRLGARHVELRCAAPLAVAQAPVQHKVNMTLALPANVDTLWRGLDKTVRNQVRKAERSGLTIEAGGVEKLPAFYDVFVSRMRDLGSPVHGYDFLRAALVSFGARARIVLARKGATTVGGLVTIAFKDRLVVPWAACLQEYFSLCPNMLLYWDTLRNACTGAVRRFDFGRSTRDSGTYRFKRQWGAEEEPLFWYTIPLRQRPGTAGPGAGRRAQLAVAAWQRLPLSVTRHVGPRIRRYLTQ